MEIDFEIGDYVLISKYSDEDPADGWAIGFLSKITIYKNKKIYYTVEGDNIPEHLSSKEFSHCRKITKRQGHKLVEKMNMGGVNFNKFL